MATYQSLYRRYRSQRFDEVLGQDHVSKALRNAVREGRVGHAYLFSGPRGTGKTSTARILAKVLNCDAPSDGEPCDTCESCVAVAENRVVDWLLEQDAASKSKVDDMRDLLERVPLGTSGNRKVIILDEVHMLSQGAENALLKTLEEPPEHVVFVLATTDPQKVRPTIRSRTQHYEFRLLPPDVLVDHVRHVIDDAGLGLGDEAIDHVIRSGGGSARDTLSALDQVAALGEVVDEVAPVTAVVDALADRDAGAVLVAVADALASGRDPRALGEAVIAALRDAFLAVMGVGETHLAPADRGRAAQVGQRMGAAGLTRALDVLGEALTELARKPDPRIVVEVALVRLTRPDTDRSMDAVLDRLDRLERGGAGGDAGGPGAAGPGHAGGSEVAGTAPGAAASAGPTDAGGPSGADRGPGGGSAAAARAALAARKSAGEGTSTPPGTAEASRPGAEGSDPTSGGTVQRPGRPTLGAVARQRPAAGGAPGGGSASASAAPAAAATDAAAPQTDATASPPGAAAAHDAPAPEAAPAQAPGEAPAPTETPASAGGGTVVGLDQLRAAWDGHVLAKLPIPVRSKWRGGRWMETDGATLRFAVDNEWHQRVCEESRRDVEAVLAEHLGAPATVAVVIEPAGGRGGASSRGTPSASGPGPGGRGPAPGGGPDEDVDPSELRDAGDVTVGGVDLLMREFGGQLVEEEQR